MSRCSLAFLFVLAQSVCAADFYVSLAGSDDDPGTEAAPFKTIQKGVNAAAAGSTVFVKAGVYNERVEIKTPGSDENAMLTLRNFGADAVVLDGTGLKAPKFESAMIALTDVSFVRVKGFEIRNYSTAAAKTVVAGIRVSGSGSHVELIECHVHHIANNAEVKKGVGRDAMGIAVYATDGAKAISALLVDGCEIDHCVLGSSESLTINGNVDGFKILNCKIHDNDNIGIVAIGAEKTARANDQARNGLIRGNTVYNINSKGNPAYGNESSAGGIYVDGGKDIVIERNLVYQADIGIEIGVEHKGKTATGVIVRDNVIHSCVVAGLGFGGYDKKRGIVQNCQFLNNTFYHNDTSRSGTGEIMIQQANKNTFKNNIVVCGEQNIMLTNYFEKSSSFDNTFSGNLYFASAGDAAVKWVWNKTDLLGFKAYQDVSVQDKDSKFADPIFAGEAPNLRLQPNSPARNAGDPAFKAGEGETDFEGKPRVNEGVVDLGAFEN